ncbi:MAG: GTP 3',8-cyclase MoaA [Steroidobacteraceae bacterium]
MRDNEPHSSRFLPVLDRRQRELRDLRISVTDRCNFRCTYCMPREHYGPNFKFLPRAEILSYEEIARLSRVFASLGVRKLRLTGGEPLLRADVPELVRMLSAIPEVEIALTTNGSLLAEKAGALFAAGLRRVTVSLDSIEDSVFRRMSDVQFPVARVLEGIEAAAQAGLRPIKINAVIQRGVNDDGIVALARHFKGSGHILRFIEFMDVGTTNGWRLDRVVSGREIEERIARELPLEPIPSRYASDVARRFRYTDGSGEIGIITSVSEPFCGDCSRGRLSSDGKFYTCLFAVRGADLRAPLRAGASDDELRALVQQIWEGREDRYSELRTKSSALVPRVEMSYIGG